MHSDDYQIMVQMSEHFLSEYVVQFEIKDVERPHCHTKTKLVHITINQLVFDEYQWRLSTGINLKKLEDL